MTNNKGGNVLVCVKNRNTAKTLILAGKKLARLKKLSLQVLYIKPSNEGFNANSDELEYLNGLARDAGAEFTIFFNDDASLIAASFAKQIHARHLIVGVNTEGINSFTETIRTLLPLLPISMIASDGKIYNMYPILGCVNIKPAVLNFNFQHV